MAAPSACERTLRRGSRLGIMVRLLPDKLRDSKLASWNTAKGTSTLL